MNSAHDPQKIESNQNSNSKWAELMMDLATVDTSDSCQVDEMVLAQYLEGRLPTEEAKQIEQLMRDDPDFAERIAILRELFDLDSVSRAA